MPHQTIEIETGHTPTAAVIWLHGLGADGSDFEPIVPELAIPDDLHIRFVFPHAPIRPVTCNGGYEMRAWYDIYSQGDFSQEDTAGFSEAQIRVDALIKDQVARGIEPDHIVLMGFSQGGAVALYAGLRFPQPLAGIGALSTYLPLRESTQADANKANAHTPIFMAHGTHDPVILYEYGKSSYEQLKQMQYNVVWKHYSMQHNVCPEEITDIAAWLVKCLGKNTD